MIDLITGDVNVENINYRFHQKLTIDEFEQSFPKDQIIEKKALRTGYTRFLTQPQMISGESFKLSICFSPSGILKNVDLFLKNFKWSDLDYWDFDKDNERNQFYKNWLKKNYNFDIPKKYFNWGVIATTFLSEYFSSFTRQKNISIRYTNKIELNYKIEGNIVYYKTEKLIFESQIMEVMSFNEYLIVLLPWYPVDEVCLENNVYIYSSITKKIISINEILPKIYHQNISAIKCEHNMLRISNQNGINIGIDINEMKVIDAYDEKPYWR